MYSQKPGLDGIAVENMASINGCDADVTIAIAIRADVGKIGNCMK